MKKNHLDERDLERVRMIRRLQELRVADRDLQQRAVVELARRLHRWRGLPRAEHPPVTHSGQYPEIALELLILRAASSRQPPAFSVGPDGAVFASEMRRGGASDDLFLTGISPALDQAALLLHLHPPGSTRDFIEYEGKFFKAGIPINHQQPFGFVAMANSRPWSRFRQRMGKQIARSINVARRIAGASPPVQPLVVLPQNTPWPHDGVLRELGYHVGRSGIPAEQRHRILSDVMAVELVSASPNADDYVSQWGTPRSRQRFDKTLNCLRSFVRLASRRSDADLSDAIDDWNEDLLWLESDFRRR